MGSLAPLFEKGWLRHLATGPFQNLFDELAPIPI
jgi:hypothetical protein